MEPWHALLVKNTPGPLPPEIPVFVAQGAKDQIVRPAVTQAYVASLCAAGSKVKMLTMPEIGHGRAAQAATLPAVDWITARFAATPPPDDCTR